MAVVFNEDTFKDKSTTNLLNKKSNILTLFLIVFVFSIFELEEI